MRFNVRTYSDKYNFFIEGSSYAGRPKNNTAMFISKKVAYLLNELYGIDQCLVFVENGMEIPNILKNKNCFVFSDNPQLAYARLATEFFKDELEQNQRLKYRLTDRGYYIGENVKIGCNPYIEPGVIIGHNVTIGDNAIIHAGAVIKNAVIGSDFICNENAVIGNYGFTMTEDENGHKYRIPSLGKVVINNHVEVGAGDDIARGSCGETVLEDYVKLDSLVHIGHDAHLHKNVEVTAGAIVGGFVEMDESSYLGLNSSIKNRKKLGSQSVIGMGANVIKNVSDGVTVIGNPAHPLIKDY